jgi:serine/threonine-protein kinase
MALNSGTRLGPYEILAPLGAGGMGEVYRAQDTRLDRIVAVKVLPQHLAGTPDARQRFEREARAVSALNHPNICTLYDVGSQDGTEYLVMEYIEGKTLAAQLEKGPLPLDQVLKISIELADALDKAHRQGIIHRDLKPGNIMLTKSGAKLLDFGLARTALPLAAGGTLTALATQTAPITQQGTILGTFQYMSPEQVEGKELDARSDLFSCGSVLYEMMTGRPAFQGRSQLSVASAILEKDPEPISTLQPMTPPALDRTIRKCLEKDPEDRWQTARDLLLELKWIAGAGSQAGVPVPVVTHRKVRERAAWSIAAVFALVAIAALIGFYLRAPKPTQPMRLSVDLGADVVLSTTFGSDAVLSPDGTMLAFEARSADQSYRLYVRPLNQLQATAISTSLDVRDPFFSPDGQSIGFFGGGKLKRISVQGGGEITLCDAPLDRGGSWSEDGTIVFGAGTRAALFKVPSTGGTPEPLTKLDDARGEVTQRYPQILPGGRAVLYTSSTSGQSFEDSDIVVYSMDSGKPKTVVHGGFYARYLPSGHIVYVHKGTLFAVAFNIDRLEATGQPTPLLEGVGTNPDTGAAQYSFSNAGTLIYVAGSAESSNLSLEWMDAAGKFTELRETPAQYGGISLSPDGKRVAMDISNGSRSDIWVYDWGRDTLTRLTFVGDQNYGPVWTPDGQRIAYASLANGVTNLWWVRADGAGAAQRLTQSSDNQDPGSFSPDGRTLSFFQQNAGADWNIWTMPIDGDEKSGWNPGPAKLFVEGSFIQVLSTFSPDGHWLAYASNESGMYEVYVRPFPGPGGRWQISAGGGSWPEWSRDGKQLFYRTSEQKIMVVSYTAAGGSFQADKPRLWSPGDFTYRGQGQNYSMAPDGKRAVVLKPASGTADAPINKLNFIFNFSDELRRDLAPAK